MPLFGRRKTTEPEVTAPEVVSLPDAPPPGPDGMRSVDDHRDYLPPALKAQGADVIAQIAIPPTESSFTRYFPQIPAETEVIYHVMVGPAVLTFVKELGEFYGSNRPQLFGFMDSLEAVDINSPGLEFLDGSHFWEGSPRYAQANDSAAQKAYRAAVGIAAVVGLVVGILLARK